MTNEPARKVNGKFMVSYQIHDDTGKFIHAGEFNYYDTNERRTFAERSLDALKIGYTVKTRKK